MKTYRHYDADYTPNDVEPSMRAIYDTRTPKEVGDSELNTIEEWKRIKEEEIKNRHSMKHVIHTPTADFAYVETEYDGNIPEVFVEEHKKLVQLVQNVKVDEKEIDHKTWNGILDEYLSTGTIVNGGDYYNDMNKLQKQVINEIKKSVNRRK